MEGSTSGSGSASSREAREEEQASIVVPTKEWDRIPTLRLISVGSPQFEAVKGQVRGDKARLEAELSQPPAEISRDVRTSMRALIEALETDSPASDEPGEARVIFLWAAAWLLEAYADALEKSPQEQHETLKRTMRNILSDMADALEAQGEESPGQPDEGPDKVAALCSSCLPAYNKCMAAPNHNATVCMNNYNYCVATCV